MYTEAELKLFRPEFQRYLRSALNIIGPGEPPARSTQLNVALALWLKESRPTAR